ncbi:MAG: dihydroorotase [Candidatus Marinimicrobia bacterium]|nr:dihydroorotase [Candidatus Neomarinimicrobiota bacterium]
MATRPLPEVVLIRGGTLYDPSTGHSRQRDVLIVDGMLAADGESVPSGAHVIEAAGCVVTHGFIDLHAHFREPGGEDKETLATGAEAAMAGGFTRVCVMANTDPPVDSPEAIAAIREKSAQLPVIIYPIGAITAKMAGLELAELRGMRSAGAVAFSDDGKPVTDGQVLRNALLYAADLGLPIINHAEDAALRGAGVMNEGALSTRLGLPGNPGMAEESMVYRDLLLAQNTGGRLHVPHVSTAGAVDQIRAFKAAGVAITAEATPHHIALTEELLRGFDTAAKVAPPLRTDRDREAVLAGLLDGVIDCIATDHAPHTVEDKELDMVNAPFGMIALESAFGLAHQALAGAGATVEQVIDMLTARPAKVMGLELTPLKPGAAAELVVVDPHEEWTFGIGDIHSKSRNTPVPGMRLRGRVRATITSKGLSDIN